MALMNRGHCVTAARANYSIFWVITRRFLSVSFTNTAPHNLLRKKKPCFVLSASMGFTLVESKTIDLISSKASSLYQSPEQWGQYLNLLSVHVLWVLYIDVDISTQLHWQNMNLVIKLCERTIIYGVKHRRLQLSRRNESSPSKIIVSLYYCQKSLRYKTKESNYSLPWI